MDNSSMMFKDIKNLEKWIQNPDSIYKYDVDMLSPELKKTYDQLGLKELCKVDNQEAKKNCEGEIILDLMRHEESKRELANIETSVKEINKIAKAIKTSKDIKESQDLANALQVQMALLQAKQIQMQIDLNAEKFNKSALEKKRGNNFMERLNNDFKNDKK